MSVKKSLFNNVIYIRFIRQDYQDSSLFRNELESTSVLNGAKDIVIDFTGSVLLTSSEIGMLICLVKELKETDRRIKLIVTPLISTALESTNMQNNKNVIIYNDKESFIKDL